MNTRYVHNLIQQAGDKRHLACQIGERGQRQGVISNLIKEVRVLFFQSETFVSRNEPLIANGYTVIGSV